METLRQDIRCVRVMRRHRGHHGRAADARWGSATSAVFSVYGVLLRPLPYPAAERLVRLSEEHIGANSPLRAPMLSNLTYHAWAGAPRTIEQFAAYRTEQYTVTRGGESSRLAAAQLTPSLLPLLGETPALGRFFAPDEVAAGTAAVMIISHRGWREALQQRSVDCRARRDDRQRALHDHRRGAAGLFLSDRLQVMMWTPLEIRRPVPASWPAGSGS